jgi:hypothetical protein
MSRIGAGKPTQPSTPSPQSLKPAYASILQRDLFNDFFASKAVDVSEERFVAPRLLPP